MERDIFIIMVFCLVSEQLDILRKSHPFRRGGFAPALSDQEVVTIEICGEYFKLNTDKDLFNYFKAHYQDWFPALSDRTSFCAPSGEPVARQNLDSPTTRAGSESKAG